MNIKNRWIIILLMAAALSGVLGGLVGGYFYLSSPAFRPEGKRSSSYTPLPSPSITPTPFELEISSVDYNTTITNVVEKASPTVVTIVGVIPGEITFSGRAPDQQVTGSGVIISTDGYVVTNNHVVADARQVDVILAGGKQLRARIVGTDRFADLAVLKVDGDQITNAATFGNSENLSPGETVVAIGSPLGKFKNTVTVGVVSAMDRSIRISENYQMEGLIQTDAAINQGNSGGPLINLAGEVVGINTLIVRGGTSAAAEGLGFAIPANQVTLIAQQIIDQGYFSRPWLGINWEWITPGIAEVYDLPVDWGAYVSNVGSNTPADRAGLQEGDIIVVFGDRELNNSNPFINALYDYAPGDTVQVSVIREGEIMELEVTLSEQPTFP